MENASLTVSLSHVMKDFIEARFREGTFSTPSEYIQSLIRTDQERDSRRSLEAFIRGGGRGRPQLDHDDWSAIRAFVVERGTAKQKNNRSKRVSAGSL
jgi:Arc/MetJ-type ribon-helix-helix transcriptional regulator